MTHHRSKQRLVKTVGHAIRAIARRHKPCPISISAKKRKTLDACARHFGSQAREREIKDEKKKNEKRKKGKEKNSDKESPREEKEREESEKKKVYGNSIIPDNGRGQVFQQAFVSRADMNQL